MDSKTINNLLADRSKQSVRARIGEKLSIDLPRVPLTRQTEFLEFEEKVEGDSGCIETVPGDDEGEGQILPRQLKTKAVRAGKLQIRFDPIDAITRERLQEVDSVVIDIEIEE